MPGLAKKITIDRKRKRVLIDGEEFPYFVSEDGPQVEDACNANAVPVVMLPVLAADVEIIPEKV